MRTGIAISGTLHVVAIAATVLGLPLFQPPVPADDQPLLVELVTVADETTSQPQQTVEETAPTPPEPQETAKPEPVKPPEPAPKPKQVAEKPKPPAPKPERQELVAPPAPEPDPVAVKPPEPAPPKEEPKPEPVAQPEPEKPAPEPEKKPVQVAEKPPEPEKKPKVEPKPEPPAPSPFASAPTPGLKPKPKPEQPAFNPNRIAALLDKSQKKETKPLLERLASKVASQEPNKPAPKARVSDQPLTMSEIDAIRYQIEQCWSVPAGARDAEDLVVRIRLFLNTDGSLSRAPELVDEPADGNDFYRTAAESARRAVLQCSPLKNLPADKYERWREVVLTFNPRQMLDG